MNFKIHRISKDKKVNKLPEKLFDRQFSCKQSIEALGELQDTQNIKRQKVSKCGKNYVTNTKLSLKTRFIREKK